MSDKTYDKVKRDFLLELDYISRIGQKIFIYPFIDRSRISLICFRIICFLTFVTALQLCTTLYVTALTTSNRFELINIAPNLGVVLVTFVKFFKIHLSRTQYKEIFEHYENEFWTGVTESSLKIISQYTRITKCVTRFLFYYCIPLIVVVNSFPRLVMFYEVHIAKKELQYLLPFDGWYPFDKIKWYYLIYLWETCMTILIIVIAGVTNSIHVAYTSFVCLELKVMGYNIENLVSSENVTNIVRRNDVIKTHAGINKLLRKIIKRHQLLAGMSCRFSTVLGDSMLLTYFFGSIFIGLTLFTATVEDNMYRSVRYFFMCCSLVIDCFYQCMIGQVIRDHSENLARSIYFADWPYADRNTKINLIILMVRTQKPFQYTAKGFLSMNLDTFSAICSHSFQLFNLIRQVYEKNK
ncbi:putative odorant receptor 59c [Amyelois transitella]|uniref:putative odorant receptor 59c n=1 Tax=Amyelois transitella TaxID=680683 RepID=UPI00067BE929|nr:putative odorant receptor 59c [Amyelois transitella]